MQPERVRESEKNVGRSRRPKGRQIESIVELRL